MKRRLSLKHSPAFKSKVVLAAVKGAKAWLTGAMAHAFAVGRGATPVNHSWPLDDKP